MEQDDEDRKSIAQLILQKSTDLLRQTFFLLKGREGSHCRACAPTVIVTRWKTTSGGLRRDIGETV